MTRESDVTEKQLRAGEVIRLRFNGNVYAAIKKEATKDKREIQDYVKVSVLEKLERAGVKL